MPQAPIRRRERPVATAVTSPLWDLLAERWLNANRARNLAPNTMSTYTQAVLGPRIRTFREDHGIAKPSDLTAEKFRTYHMELRAAGMKPSTLACYHTAIKTFMKFCKEEGLDFDPGALQVKAPEMDRTMPDIYTPAEIKILMAAAGPRDRVIVEVLHRTGLRLNELTNLTVDDVVTAPEGSYLIVRLGKMRKPRLVPLDTPGHKMSKVLTRYIATVRPKSSSNALFLTRSKTPLSREAIKHLLYRLGEQVGVHCHAHKFRRTFCSEAVHDRVDPHALQRVMGHTTLGMVSRYVNLDPAALCDAWAKRGAA